MEITYKNLQDNMIASNSGWVNGLRKTQNKKVLIHPLHEHMSKEVHFGVRQNKTMQTRKWSIWSYFYETYCKPENEVYDHTFMKHLYK